MQHDDGIGFQNPEPWMQARGGIPIHCTQSCRPQPVRTTATNTWAVSWRNAKPRLRHSLTASSTHCQSPGLLTTHHTGHQLKPSTTTPFRRILVPGSCSCQLLTPSLGQPSQSCEQLPAPNKAHTPWTCSDLDLVRARGNWYARAQETRCGCHPYLLLLHSTTLPGGDSEAKKCKI